ncbi:KTSC domain-containing protein [Mycobacterium sp. KBS0706]|uniref:KTSC domain-containing protein n=1 Tax=Mycobacterium sp. KBS0706 TaxID=2578109 RepID=UPI00110FAE5E|nr:KTSC domain-containing protein [Mycobacterium sp. KBS0706]TSD89213.1 KTSC domain-containing protein [Mycobacterium sp. KBS0706]
MPRIPIESNAVSSVGYDPRAKALDIEYAGGAIYRYAPVPDRVVWQLLRAPSKDRFVNARIRDAYPFRRIA